MKGIYILLISVNRNISLSVGAKGKMNFQKGFYAYVGSAQNNLEKRVKRHLEKVKQKFWHVDYLLSSRQAEVVEIFYKEAGKAEECRIARKLAKTAVSIKCFGSSDCRCRSHLFRVETRGHLSELMFDLGAKPLSGTV
jgi:Uri superfamily endonuclease